MTTCCIKALLTYVFDLSMLKSCDVRVGAGDVQAINAEKQEQIKALKDALGEMSDSVEGEQDRSGKVTQELAALQRELSNAQSAKGKADSRVEDLSARIADAETKVMRFP